MSGDPKAAQPVSGSLYHRVADALLALEAEMRRLSMWAETAPAASAFASTAPFCIDTMELPQWLQFVFIPNMRTLIEHGAPLPSDCGITAIAEETVARERSDCGRLLRRLRRIDRLLTRPHEPDPHE